jgi:hypothetical protein
MTKNEFSATGNDGQKYVVVRIPSSITRGPLDDDLSVSGNYSYYLYDGTRLNWLYERAFQTSNGKLIVTLD